MWLKHKNKCYLFVAEFPRNKCLVPEVLFERLFFFLNAIKWSATKWKCYLLGKCSKLRARSYAYREGERGENCRTIPSISHISIVYFHDFHFEFPVVLHKSKHKKTKRAESRLCLRDCHSICHDSKMVKWKSSAWLLMLMSHSCHNCQHMCTMFVVRHIHQLECRIRYTESIPTKFIHKILAVNVLQSIDWVNLWDLAPSNVIEHISGVPTNKQSNIA